MLHNLYLLLIGILIYPFRSFFGVKKNRWIFGSDKGMRYTQNSRYLFEYVLKRNSNISCYWITQSKTVLYELEKEGLPVLYNLSFKGILYSLTAEVTFFSTGFTDILYSFSNDKSKKFVYLCHGMPTKKAHYDFVLKKNSWNKMNTFILKKFIAPQRVDTASLIPATSSFFKDILSQCCRNKNIVVTGQPRTDNFFLWDKTKLKIKYGFAENDFIVTYMPTHRGYGRGIRTPNIFINNSEAQKYFLNNGVKIVWKHHMNMVDNYIISDDLPQCFSDFSILPIDSQELLYISDVLITDYSSCYIDYLMLERPVLFYLYDNFAIDDNDVYFTPEQYNLGLISNTEEALLQSIKNAYERGIKAIPAVEFHKYKDVNSCERVYVSVLSMLASK